MELKKELRKFGLSAFRNIGYLDDKPHQDNLTLNYSLDKDYIGDLVILIGPNNAGKSNVLDALECFIKNKISDRDKSDNFMNPDLRNPFLDLYTIKDGKKYDLKPENKSKTHASSKIHANNNKKSKWVFNYEPFLNAVPSNSQEEKDLIDFIVETLNDNSINLIKENENCTYKDCLKALMLLEEDPYEYSSWGISTIRKLKENPKVKKFLDAYEAFYANGTTDDTTSDSDEDDEKNEDDANTKDLSNYLPRIICYTEDHITNSDLNCDADDISNSKFFNGLLKIMGSNIKELENTYDNLRKTKNHAILGQQSRKLSKGLDKISKYFNELYCLDNDTYKFDIYLESTGVNFSLYKEETKPNGDKDLVALVLDHQSTGFRWFFDLFFNVFAANDLCPGDIIIMDEPATNLHVKGQEELRKFLKDFAMKNGITFIIATHSPFLVDLDYLDEIRLISLHDNNVAKIDNVFSAVNVQDADSLKPIRESLTVRSSVLLDPDQIVVFVEGITDYNYLVGMKSLDKSFSNITFLPIHGLGKDTNEKLDRLNQLHKIRKHHSILLTDGDEAGEEFSKLNAQTAKKLNILKLTDVNPSFKEIENLFSDEDKIKFNVSEKDTGLSIIFKKIVNKHPEEISDTTKNNFVQLFKAIQKQFPTEDDSESPLNSTSESSKSN